MKFKLQSGCDTFHIESEQNNSNHSAIVQPIAGGRTQLVGNDVIRISGTLRHDEKNLKRVTLNGFQRRFLLERVLPVQPKAKKSASSGGDIKSPMSGKIVSVQIKPGDLVNVGDLLMTIEAMKMENRIVSELTGIAATIRAEPGQSVTTGDLLISIKAAP